MRTVKILTSIVLAGLGYIGYYVHSQNQEVEMRVRSIANVCYIHIAVEAYRTEYGTFPPTPENYILVKTLTGENPHKIVFIERSEKLMNANNEFIDGYGIPIRIVFSSSTRALILSAGKDRLFYTAGDIRSDDE